MYVVYIVRTRIRQGEAPEDHHMLLMEWWTSENSDKGGVPVNFMLFGWFCLVFFSFFPSFFFIATVVGYLLAIIVCIMRTPSHRRRQSVHKCTRFKCIGTQVKTTRNTQHTNARCVCVRNTRLANFSVFVFFFFDDARSHVWLFFHSRIGAWIYFEWWLFWVASTAKLMKYPCWSLIMFSILILWFCNVRLDYCSTHNTCTGMRKRILKTHDRSNSRCTVSEWRCKYQRAPCMHDSCRTS